MGKKVVAGNWKMNTTPAEGVKLAQEISGLLRGRGTGGVEVVVFPPYTHLDSVRSVLGDDIALGAQDCSPYEPGAHTGQISVEMLVALGCRSVMVGHSECRRYNNEGTYVLSRKIERALDAGLDVMYCVGESQETRAHGEPTAWGHVADQLAVLGDFEGRIEGKLTVAYEPVWAIGTGKTASAHDVERMCGRVQDWLTTRFREKGASIPVLYGGSCNAKNARELFAVPGVSGGLIGGASLKAAEFVEIVHSF